MSTISHPPVGAVQKPAWEALLRVREVWASLAITAMWAAVSVTALWGPDFVASSGFGADSATIPSGIFVAVFAVIGTWAVAKYAFGQAREEL